MQRKGMALEANALLNVMIQRGIELNIHNTLMDGYSPICKLMKDWKSFCVMLTCLEMDISEKPDEIYLELAESFYCQTCIKLQHLN